MGMSKDGRKMKMSGNKGGGGSKKGARMTMKGKADKSDTETRQVGAYTVAEVEAAFGLSQGSLKLPGDKGFEKLSKNNFWTEYWGIPIVLERLNLIAEGLGIRGFLSVAAITTTFVSYFEGGILELPVGGCFYTPKDPSTEPAFAQLGLQTCYDFVPYLVTWTIVGYVDESTRLMFNKNGSPSNYSAGSVDDLKEMTQLVLFRAGANFPLQGQEIFAYTSEGPNYGDYAGYASPGIEFDPNLQELRGNVGKFMYAVETHDVTAPCPDKYCGDLIPGFIPNAYAPAWPAQLEEVQCEMFFNSDIPGCE